MEAKGAKIKGSRFIRDFCARCGEPMRVVRIRDSNGIPVEHFCKECNPGRPPQFAARQEGGGNLSARQLARLGQHQG